MYRIYPTIHNSVIMYHIANDRRQIETASRICEGLTRCLSQHKMSEISVSDIATASGVSRSTFYRSFDIPLDVLSYAVDKRLKDMVGEYHANGVRPEDGDAFVLFTLRYWRQHSDVLEAFVNCDRMDVVRNAIESHTGQFIAGELKRLRSDFTDKELDYISSGAAGMIASLLSVWIKHGKKETPEELFALYLKVCNIAEEFMSNYSSITK